MPVAPPDPVADAQDPRVACRATGLLAAYNRAGVLDAADVHVATRLAQLAGEERETVALAGALTVRAARLGHVLVDLHTLTSILGETDDPDLPAPPEPSTWLDQLRTSPLLTEPLAPLILQDSRVYLRRLYDDEQGLADDLLALAWDHSGVDDAALAASRNRLFAPDDPAAEVAALAVRRHLSVIAGGPGTGKTTTVARILALLLEQPAERPPVIGLCAPTGKAAARLTEAVAAQAAELDTTAGVRRTLESLTATTIHRLLGPIPGNRTRFRHHRANRLPHDVIVVDETSMVSLSLMARLLEAVRAGARLVLMGDPDQLASVEAGAVLGDIVGPARAGQPSATGQRNSIGRSVARLTRPHRFGGEIAALAEAIRRGDAAAAVDALRNGGEVIVWIPEDAAARQTDLAAVRSAAVSTGVALVSAARAGDAAGALGALSAFRLLCAHRRGPYGVARWSVQLAGWIESELRDFDATAVDRPGRPLLIERTDRELDLANGDTGVIIATPEGPMAAFPGPAGPRLVGPLRVAAAQTLYAMTIHKSQGSQFGTAAAILPPPESPLMTRELLYTGVTRAQHRLIVVGTPESVQAAVERPVARASGLRGRLWPDAEGAGVRGGASHFPSPADTAALRGQSSASSP